MLSRTKLLGALRKAVRRPVACNPAAVTVLRYTAAGGPFAAGVPTAVYTRMRVR